MNSAWRHSPMAERHGPPVEMRFIDMFMAALGALIFMAMLLAFLLRFYPAPGTPSVLKEKGSIPVVAPFELITKTLAPARVGESYEVAFAFRGGLPPTTWEITAGESEIPAGLRFDNARGALSGTPEHAGGVAHFVVRAKDQMGNIDSRPYDLAILEPIKTSRKIESSLAISMFIALLLLWLGTLGVVADLKKKLATLLGAQAEGQSTVTFAPKPGVQEVHVFDAGAIESARNELSMYRRISRFFLIVLLLMGLWLAWRLWFS